MRTTPQSDLKTSDLQEIGRTNALKPKESDFIGKKGYRRYYRKDGSYSWRYKFAPNDGHGRLTKEATEVGEMMKPYQRADIERAAKLNRWPGEYGVATKPWRGGAVCHEFCERCERLLVWCECGGGKDAA